MKKKLRAITICQPYAELIMRKVKHVENRTWKVHVGPIVIHAGKGKQWWKTHLEPEPRQNEVPHGAIVGVAIVAQVLKIDDDWHGWEKFRNHHASGPLCWALTHRQRVKEPVPCNGYQGVWSLQPKHHGVELEDGRTIADYFAEGLQVRP